MHIPSCHERTRPIVSGGPARNDSFRATALTLLTAVRRGVLRHRAGAAHSEGRWENERRIGGLIAKQTPRWVLLIRWFKFKQTDEAVQVNEHPGGSRLMCYKKFPLQIAKWDNRHLTVEMEGCFGWGRVSPSFKKKKKGWGLVFFERAEKVLQKQYSKDNTAKRDVNFILQLLSKYVLEVIKKPTLWTLWCLRNIARGDTSLKMNTLRYGSSQGQVVLHSFLYNIF